jgi:hypothetical protein
MGLVIIRRDLFHAGYNEPLFVKSLDKKTHKHLVYVFIIIMDVALEEFQAKLDDLAKRMYPDAGKVYPSLYIISLENECLFFHVSDPKPYEQIIEESQKYEYVQTNKPIKVLYEMKKVDLEEVDPLVEKFMDMFGKDSVECNTTATIFIQT